MTIMDKRLFTTSSTINSLDLDECTAAVLGMQVAPSLPTGLPPRISALFAELCGEELLCPTSLRTLQGLMTPSGLSRSAVAFPAEMDSFYSASTSSTSTPPTKLY